MKLFIIFLVSLILCIGNTNGEVRITWESIVKKAAPFVEKISSTSHSFYRYHESDPRLGALYKSVCDTKESIDFTDDLVKLRECNNNGTWESVTICNYLEHRFGYCLKPISEKFEDCLDEEHKFLPEFILNTILSLTKKMCSSPGESMMEFLHPCMSWRKTAYKCYNDLSKASENVKVKRLEQLTKNQWCSGAKIIKACSTELTTTCKSPDSKSNIDSWVHALTQQCDNHVFT